MKKQLQKLQNWLKTQPLAGYARRTSFAIVGICLFLVTFMVTTKLLFTEDVIATSDFRAMARVYYEDYYYDTFVGERSGVEREAIFQPYMETGFRPITLRELLTFDSGRLASKESQFIGCDKIHSNVKITPTPPFGKTDYRIETTLVCSNE
ncbi:MAG: hypothetical protein ACK5MU_03195 [Candidatus Saccharimonadales bacterium]